jgi:hypothetical protein
MNGGYAAAEGLGVGSGSIALRVSMTVVSVFETATLLSSFAIQNTRTTAWIKVAYRAMLSVTERGIVAP